MSYFHNGHAVYRRSWVTHDIRLNPLKTGKKAHKKLMQTITNHLTPKLKEELDEIALANKRLGRIKS